VLQFTYGKGAPETHQGEGGSADPGRPNVNSDPEQMLDSRGWFEADRVPTEDPEQ